MRASMRKIILPLAFVMACFLVLVSCEQESSQEMPQEISERDVVDDTDPSAAPEQEQHPVYRERGLQRYDPPIELSFVGENSIFIEDLTRTFPGETLSDNRWTRLYEDVLGIKIVYDWIEKGDMYGKKLGVAISSGNIPDVVRVDASQLRLLSNAGRIQDLTEAYEEYATDFTKEVLTQEGLSPFQAATIEGKLMGIPQIDSSIDKASLIWIRTDWLDNLGLEPPRTMDELIEIAKAFTEKDPDQNGVNDTFGLAATHYLWDPVAGLAGFMAGYHAYPQLWIDDGNGGLVYGGIQPEVKVALAQLQELYRQGVLDPSFALKKGEQVKQDIADGKIGIMYGEQWGAFHVAGSRDTDPNANWQAYPIVSADDHPPKVPLKFTTSSFFAVRTGYEHPEAIVKLFNLHLEKNWGETAEYEVYYNDSGSIWQMSPVTPYPPMKNLNAFREIRSYEKGELTAFKTQEAQAIWTYIQSYREDGYGGGWGWERIYGPHGAYAIIDAYEKNGQLLYDQFTGVSTPTMIDQDKFLHNLQNETYINIILGEPLEEFDRFVEQWRSLGGDQITREVNEWYQTHVTNTGR